jgi:hypothetical protein
MGGGGKIFILHLQLTHVYQVNFLFGATAGYKNKIFYLPMFVLTPIFHPNLFLQKLLYCF